MLLVVYSEFRMPQPKFHSKSSFCRLEISKKKRARQKRDLFFELIKISDKRIDAKIPEYAIV